LQKYYYNYEEFIKDTKILIEKTKVFKPECILAIARGGLMLGQYFAYAYDTRNLFALNSIHYDKDKKLDTFKVFNIPDLSDYKKVLILDDIIDSGESMSEILKLLKKKYPKCEFNVAALFYKKTSILKPEFYVKEATKWIDFCWETDTLEK